jgi:YegS/Rv2252/BmrU family lipid kinase
MSVAVIINPISGRHSGAVGARVDLARRIAAECSEPIDVSVTEARGHARALARAAKASGASRIVAWGGDGTINEIATELAFDDLPLGIVAGGSGNGLARELALPARPEQALRKAFTGPVRSIDVGSINNRLFVNLAGIGFDAHVAALFNSPGNRRRGARAYVMLTARTLFSYQPRRYRITANGDCMSVRALLVVIANGTEFGNRVLIARGARVDDGALDVVVVEERSRASTISRVPWLVTRSIHRVPMWSSRRAQDVTVESDAPMPFHVDGESVLEGATTLRARVHPGALRVIA